MVNNSIQRKYRRLLAKETCEMCGFIAKHVCQLDIHHKDGDHNNNRGDNLIVLCANCHRLETYLSSK